MNPLVTFAGVMRAARNPLPLFLDRLSLRKRTYVLKTRTGLQLEIRPRRGDRFAFYETMVMNQYLRQGQRLRPGDTVIDVGANIGCFTVRAAKAVGPSGRVIAIEPEESTFSSLQRNLALNGCDNVEAKRLAAAGRSGTVQLRVGGNSLFNSLFENVGGVSSGSSSQQVPSLTLADLMESSRISRCHYLKMDCEGAEYDVFFGMQKDTAERIDQITMEVHRVPGYEPQALRSRLTELGFRHELGALLYAWR